MKKIAIYLSLILFMVLGSFQTTSAQTLIEKEKTANKNIKFSMTNTETSPMKVESPAATSAAVSKIESFKAGGIPINIPPPSADLIEVGYDIREQMEIFVPASNRLLCGYMKDSDLPHFVKGEENFILSKYAFVQVGRCEEYQDIKESDFKELVDYMKNSLDDDIDSITKASEAEFNSRMESMDLSKVSIGKPIQLGTFFSKPDAYSFGMISTTSNGKKSWTMVVGTTFVRVHERLLYVYLFAEYKNNETIAMVRKVSEEWADAILAANK